MLPTTRPLHQRTSPPPHRPSFKTPPYHPTQTPPKPRQIYHGEALRGLAHVGRFVESFTDDDGDLWLVFIDEGISLHSWLYTTQLLASGATVLVPTESWRMMRTMAGGRARVAEVMAQLLTAAAAIHERNTTHRDIKTSNVVLSLRPANANANANNKDSNKDGAGTDHGGGGGGGGEEGSGDAPSSSPSPSPSLHFMLIDFSSAYSPEALRRGLFGTEGPTRNEETVDSMPPEVSCCAALRVLPCEHCGAGRCIHKSRSPSRPP